MAAGISFLGVEVISESTARVNGFVNGCGQAAVLMMAHLQNGQPVNANSLLNLIKFSIATGNATTSGRHIGSTNAADVQWLAEQEGVKTKLGSGSSWQGTVDAALASGRIPVMGVGNAKAFGGSDANVAGHWVTFVGKTGDGRYVVADPNQQAAKSGGTVVYTADQINQAKPFATLTPVSAAQYTSGASEASMTSDNSGKPQYSVSLYPGNTTDLDPLVDGLIRASLIIVGVVLVVIGILIFTRKDIPAVAEAGADAAKAAAL